MSVTRQDAWSKDDDLMLAEITLRHIREGSTQLNAFEEVGERIGRTAAACGFRWNSYVRKKYEAAIQIAKAQRKKRSQVKKHSNLQGASISSLNQDDVALNYKLDVETDESLSIDAVIRFLRQWKTVYQDTTRHIKNLERMLKASEEEAAKLRRENEKLHKEVNNVQTDYNVVNDDYRALIQIMDRARKMAFLVEEEDGHKPRFKMDANGNLERIE